MAKIRVRKVMREEKTISPITPLDVIINKSIDKIIICLDHNKITDYKEREGIIDKIHEMITDIKVSTIVLKISNDINTIDDLLFKNEITIDDVPESVKDEIKTDK